jgi:hypothetical protein
MHVYIYILLALNVITAGYNLGRGDRRAFYATLINFSVYLPVMGRVLNWW